MVSSKMKCAPLVHCAGRKHHKPVLRWCSKSTPMNTEVQNEIYIFRAEIGSENLLKACPFSVLFAIL